MEDKELLQAIKQIIAPLENDMKEMKSDISGMKTDMADLKDRLENVEHEVIKTKLKIENEVIPGIQAVKEKFLRLPEIVEKQTERIDGIEEDVIMLKVAVFSPK